MSTNPAAVLDFLAAMGVRDVVQPAPVDWTVPVFEPNPFKRSRTQKTAPIPAPRPTATTSGKLRPVTEWAQLAEEAAQQAQTLDQLKVAIQAFEGCELKALAMNTVFADGVPDAEVMAIGEAPGADEDLQGKPFVGLSGQLLDKIFGSIGLSRAKNLYITNILPWRPPGNRQPSPAEVTMCLPFVRRHIQLVSPKTVILVGGVSAKAVLGRDEPITRLRSRWHENVLEGMATRFIATYHPAFLLRSPAQKAAVWQDMLMVKVG